MQKHSAAIFTQQSLFPQNNMKIQKFFILIMKFMTKQIIPYHTPLNNPLLRDPP